MSQSRRSSRCPLLTRQDTASSSASQITSRSQDDAPQAHAAVSILGKETRGIQIIDCRPPHPLPHAFAGLIINNSGVLEESPHPRASFSTQDLTNHYLEMLESHRTWLAGFTEREAAPPDCPDYPHLDSAKREGDNREPIPSEERNFYCTSKLPVKFEFGAETKLCRDPPWDLAEVNMAARWKDDYIGREERVEQWFEGTDGLLSEMNVDVSVTSKRTFVRGLYTAKAKFVGAGRSLRKKSRGALEGNALS